MGKGLTKENMPRVGDIICLDSDPLGEVLDFTVQVAIQDHPGQLKAATFDAKKSTGGQKVESPDYVERNDMAQIVFSCVQPLIVTPFKECAGLGRVALMDSNALVMLGKVTQVNYKK